MFPLLFKIGPLPVHTYGFLIAVGFLMAVGVIRRLAERSKLDVDRTLDLTFWCLVVGFGGARLLYVITRFSTFMMDPVSIFRVWEGGLVFLGGPLAVLPFLVWYFKKYRLPMWSTADALVPGLTIAHAMGRLGCLAAGCCYGKPTDLPWGIRLTSELVDPLVRGVALHPTQLYESASLLALFLGLLWVHRARKFEGQVALTYFMAYPIIRSVIEVFRGDQIRGFVIDQVLSTSQFLSIWVFVGAAFLLLRRLRQVNASSAKEPSRAASQGS
jgi:phosphatidylglycerol:prolipoprotein diacylglycerol transferase